jgi:hypothetical protein
LNSDCLKSLITDNTYTIESKFVNSRTNGNVSNFIFVSNNYLSIKIENGDRRYVIFKTSNECKNNFDFFDGLNKTVTHEFYYTLYKYFINRDLTEPSFTPRLIPITDIKNDMIESCKESIFVTGVKYYSKDPCYLSLFQGYQFDNTYNNNTLYNNHTLIKPFLDRILNIISDHNNDRDNYILNWLSYLLQSPGSKTKTACIIIGEQDTDNK